MHSLIRTRLAFRNVALPVRTAARYSSTSTMHDNDPEVLEREKQRNLSNTQHKTSTPHAEAPGWNEYLATSSEADVKADRTTDTIYNLQRKTVEHVRARYASDDRVDSHEADYLRDAVEGPLSGAQGTEDTGLHEESEVTKEVIRKESRKVHKGPDEEVVAHETVKTRRKKP